MIKYDNIKCGICGREFTPKKSTDKYCKSEKCKAKAKSNAVIRYRKKNDVLKVKTLHALRTQEPYKTNYESIVNAIKEKHEIDEQTISYIIRSANIYKEEMSKLENPIDLKDWLTKTTENRVAEEKITWPYLLKETGLSRNTLSKYVKTMRKLGAMEEKGFELSGKHEYEPLKIWYDDIIMNCPAGNVYQFFDSTLFSSTIPISLIKKQDRSVLNYGMLNKDYYYINQLYRKLGLRSAGIKWKKHIRSMQLSPATKLFFWLHMVATHYLVTLGVVEKNEGYSIKEIPHVDSTLVEFMENRNFEPPFHIPISKGDIILPEWQKEFFELLDNAFYRYVLQKNPSINRKNLEKEINNSNYSFKKILADTLYERVNAEIFLIISHPEILPSYSRKAMEDNVYSVHDLWKASKIGYDFNEKIKESVKMESSPSFFDRTQFFKGLVTDELIDAGNPEDQIEHFRQIKENELYNQLRHLANAFEVPTF